MKVIVSTYHLVDLDPGGWEAIDPDVRDRLLIAEMLPTYNAGATFLGVFRPFGLIVPKPRPHTRR